MQVLETARAAFAASSQKVSLTNLSGRRDMSLLLALSACQVTALFRHCQYQVHGRCNIKVCCNVPAVIYSKQPSRRYSSRESQSVMLCLLCSRGWRQCTVPSSR